MFRAFYYLNSSLGHFHSRTNPVFLSTTARNLIYIHKINTMDKKEEQKQPGSSNEPALKPDKETTHTTDPQEHMEGPVSSFMQNIKETAEENNKETKEEADKKKDENT